MYCAIIAEYLTLTRTGKFKDEFTMDFFFFYSSKDFDWIVKFLISNKTLHWLFKIWKIEQDCQKLILVRGAVFLTNVWDVTFFPCVFPCV